MIDLIGQKLGDALITAKLGAGGMADVYRATQTAMNREVAVKVIQPGRTGQADLIPQFEQEARLIASLSHPHIVKIFNFGVLKGFYLKLIDPAADPRRDMVYFVMELLPGGTLMALIDQGPLPLDQVRQFMRQIADALDYAHQKGVTHRDLKPQNVLLDENQNVILADFGIATLRGRAETPEKEGVLRGTPYYMAPEQWDEAPTGAWTDVYALGILLWEMLTGEPPYQGETVVALFTQHKNGPIPHINAIRPDLPTAMQGVFERALAKDPADRFPSAQDLRTAFEAALGVQRAPVSKPAISVQPGPSPATNLAPATTPIKTGGAAFSPALILGGALGGAGVIFLIVALIVFARSGAGSVEVLKAGMDGAQAVEILSRATGTAGAAQATNNAIVGTISPNGAIQATLQARATP